MDTRPVDAPHRGRLDTPPSLDPLRRVFVPIEKRTSSGMMTFTTTDGQQYYRDAHGVIRSRHPKVNGKAARKARRN